MKTNESDRGAGNSKIVGRTSMMMTAQAGAVRGYAGSGLL